jgi:hypothetical protein
MILVQMKMPKWLSTLVLLSTFIFELIKIVKFWVILLGWIRIQPTKIDADPDPKHWFKACFRSTILTA